MSIDRKMTPDVFISISYHTRAGLWSSETAYLDEKGKQKRYRQAGHFPALSPHALQAVAVLSGLRLVSTRVRQTITDRTGRLKPRVRITAMDQSFIAAFTSASNARKSLKAGKRYKDTLTKTLYKFEWEFVTTNERTEPGILGLKNWMNNALSPKRNDVDAIERLLTPATAYEQLNEAAA